MRCNSLILRKISKIYNQAVEADSAKCHFVLSACNKNKKSEAEPAV